MIAARESSRHHRHKPKHCILDFYLAHFCNIDSNISQANLRLFHDACNKDILDRIQTLVQHGYPVNSHADSSFGEGLSGYTPLHFAVKNRNREAVVYLLKTGADITEKSANGWTPVHQAYYTSSKHLIPTIFEHSGVNTHVNAADERGLTHFHICCTLNVPSIVEDFIASGADINCSTSPLPGPDSGFTALHFAVKNEVDSDNPILTLLLENGADHSLRCEGGLTPLHLACELDATFSAKILLNFGADCMASDDKNRLPLHCAFYRNHKSFIADELFEKLPADCNHADYQRLSVLHMACISNKLGIVKRLLIQGCCPDARIIVSNKNSNETLFADRVSLAGLTPLHMALCAVNWRNVEKLILAGADINAKDDKGNTPLWYYNNSFLVSLAEKERLIGSECSQLNVIIVNHITSLEAAGLYVNEQVKKDLSECSLLGIYVRRFVELPMCAAELEKLQRMKIKNTANGLNLRSILRKNEMEMSRLAKNESVTTLFSPKYFETLDQECYYYGFMVEAQFNKGLRRAAMLEKANDALNCFFPFNMPDLCSELILSYLTNDDLEILIDASSVVQKVVYHATCQPRRNRLWTTREKQPYFRNGILVTCYSAKNMDFA